MVRPERRTKADIFAAATIAVVVAVVAAVVWWTSDARTTISRPAVEPAPNPTPAREVPPALDQLWAAPSSRTAGPLVVAGTVVTADGGEVVGRDPVTGRPRWTYARDTDLCAVSWVEHYVVAVYPDSRGCGQVSTIDSVTGRRGPSRSDYADKHLTLSSDGTMALAAGNGRLEMWRADMIRALSYGETDALINPPPKTQKRCPMISVAGSSKLVSVLEACPNKRDLRLTLLKPAKDEDKPDVRYVLEPGVKPDSCADILAVSDTTTAVYIPSPRPKVVSVNESGATVASMLLPKPASATATQHAVTRAGDLVTWWTGDSVVVFDAATMTHRYTIAAAEGVTPLGPATMMADRLLIPVTGGTGVYDPATGAEERVIPVSRPPEQTGPIVPAVTGSTVIEQRGSTVVALGWH